MQLLPDTEPPRNGRFRVANSYSTQPQAQTSLAVPYGLSCIGNYNQLQSPRWQAVGADLGQQANEARVQQRHAWYRAGALAQPAPSAPLPAPVRSKTAFPPLYWRSSYQESRLYCRGNRGSMQAASWGWAGGCMSLAESFAARQARLPDLMPKSPSLTSPPRISKLAGLMSLWMTP
jgi:hypothetical protein